jgi:hypothetical protein
LRHQGHLIQIFGSKQRRYLAAALRHDIGSAHSTESLSDDRKADILGGTAARLFNLIA